MNFDFYDIFAKLIPGGLILCVLMACGWLTPIKDYPDALYLLAAYLIGYMVDAIGYEVQERILRKKSFNQFPTVFEKYKHLDKIKTKLGITTWTYDELTKHYSTMYHTANSIDKRLKSFQDHWLGARNLFIAALCAYVVGLMEIKELNISSPKWLGLVLMLSAFLGLFFLRARGRQKLLFKQVLNSYLFAKESKGTEA